MNTPSNDIIERVLAGLGTKEEARQTASWFATPEGQNRLSQLITSDLEQVGTAQAEQVAVGHAIPSEKMMRQIEAAIRRRRMRRRWLSVAAIVFPIVLLLGIGVKLHTQVDLFGTDPLEEIYVARGEKLQFVFQDGTHVYVNSDTHLYYPRRFGLTSRRIRIEGEAYFSVRKNRSRPFIVESQGCEVQVLGTEFNLDAYPDSKEIVVSLDSGHVCMEGGGKSYDLQPHQQLVYDKRTGTAYINSEVQTESVSRWRKNILSFQDTSFEQVIAELSRWFDTQFEVKDFRAYKYSFTISLENNQLESILRDLEMVAPVKFNCKGGVVEVTVTD